MIVEVSKLYASYIETTYNASVFAYDYREAMMTLNSAIGQKRGEYAAFDQLFEDDRYHDYLLILRRLVHTKRWNQNKRRYPISVMTHLVVVAFISHILYLIEKEHG